MNLLEFTSWMYIGKRGHCRITEKQVSGVCNFADWTQTHIPGASSGLQSCGWFTRYSGCCEQILLQLNSGGLCELKFAALSEHSLLALATLVGLFSPTRFALAPPFYAHFQLAVIRSLGPFAHYELRATWWPRLCFHWCRLEEQMEQAALAYLDLLEGNEKPVAGSTCEYKNRFEFSRLSLLLLSFLLIQAVVIFGQPHAVDCSSSKVVGTCGPKSWM